MKKTFVATFRKFSSISKKFPIKATKAFNYAITGLTLATITYISNQDGKYFLLNNNNADDDDDDDDDEDDEEEEEEDEEENPDKKLEEEEVPEKYYLGDQEFMEHESKFSKKFYFQCGGAMIPHDDKVEKGGEDAYFATRVAVGVADGVGGWAKKGIDSGIYSANLMNHCREHIEQGNRNPLEVLKYAHGLCNKIIGSTTAVLVVLNGEELDILNVGDSGVLVMNPVQRKIKLRTTSQQSRFNCPYQLGSNNSYTPDHGEKYTVSVSEGDLVVVGSDGLFDNLYDHEICQILEHIEKEDGGKKNPILLARSLALSAYAVSHSTDATKKTPFAEEAQRHNRNFSGGKEDDITVVVCRVKEREVSVFSFLNYFRL